MSGNSMLTAVFEAGRILRAGTCDLDPSAFQDDFQDYEDDRGLMTAWASNTQIFLYAAGKNRRRRLRCWIPESFWGKVCVWVERSPTVDLSGRRLTVNVRYPTRILLGAVHFYVGQGNEHYRSVSGCLLRDGVCRKTLSISNIAQSDFVEFAHKRCKPDLNKVSRVGVCFSAIASKDGGSVEIEYFGVGTLPWWLMNLAAARFQRARSMPRGGSRRRTLVPL